MHVRGRGWPASGLVPMRMHARMAWGTQSGDETAVSTSATSLAWLAGRLHVAPYPDPGWATRTMRDETQGRYSTIVE